MENNLIEYPIHPLIEKRKSIRSFSDKEVDDNSIHLLFEAARWSFSSGNEQPWRFIYGKNKDDIWQKLVESLMDGNKSWCVHAPLLMLVLSKKQTNKGTSYKHNFHDTGAATMLMAIQAVEMGLQLHPMAGFIPEQLYSYFNLPDNLEPVTMLAVGYPNSDLSVLSDRQRSTETTRGTRLAQKDFILNYHTSPLLK